jgi:ferritin-like metal-binding protein YciE
MATTKIAPKSATKGLDDLFLDGLKDIYYAEKKILKALPKMANGAEGQEVKQAFEKHLAETGAQVERLEQVFELIGVRRPCRNTRALLRLTQAWWGRRKPSSTTRSPATAP